MNFKNKSLLLTPGAIPLFVISISGFLLILFETNKGVDISPDGIIYMGSAQNLLKGNGLSLPYFDATVTQFPVLMTHYPPLYPMLLTIGGLLGTNIFVIAAWVNAIIFGLNIWLLSKFVYRQTEGSVAATLITGLLILTSVDLLNLHSSAMSEPLFLFCLTVGTTFLIRYLKTSTQKDLVFSALALGLGGFTRYAGLAFIGGAVITILLFEKTGLKRRLINAFIFGFIGILPIGLWSIRNFLISGTSTNRNLSFHLPGDEHWQTFLTTLSGWFPFNTFTIYTLLVFVIIGVGFAIKLYLSKNKKTSLITETGESLEDYRLLVKIITCLCSIYFVFLLVSITLFDYLTLLDYRILSPIYILGVVLGVVSIDKLLKKFDKQTFFKNLVLFISVLFIAILLKNAGRWSISHYFWQDKYYNDNWQNSALIKLVKDLPGNIRIYTNDNHYIYALTGKPSFTVPYKIDPFTNRENPNFYSDEEFVKDEIQNNNAVLVYLNTDYAKAFWFFPSETELKNSLSISPVYSSPEGTFYSFANK